MGKFAGTVLLCSLLLLTLTGRTQKEYDDPLLNRPLRIEIPVGSDRETYRVIPCASDGFLLFYKSVETAPENKVKWYFSLYDKNLQPIWTRGVPLAGDADFRERHGNGDTLSLFFQTAEPGKAASNTFQLLRVLVRKGGFILNNGVLPDQATLSAFTVTGQRCFAGLNIRNEQARLMILDLPTGKQEFVTITGGTHTSFAGLEADEGDQMLTAVIRKQLAKRYWDHYLFRIKSDGTILGETLISPGTPDRQLADPKICSILGSEKFIGGSYVLTSSLTDQQQKQGSTKSTGLFAARFSGLIQQRSSFNNYLDLQSAGDLLSEREMMALRKKAMKKNRILPEYSADLNILIHDIIRHDDQFIVLGETYYLQFHTESFTDFDYYGRPYSNSYSVFDGYRFTNAIAAAYDASGKLLWDHSMPIRNLLSREPDPKVSLTFIGDAAVLCYLSDGKIGYKVIRGGETVEKMDYTDVELSLSDDRLVSETRSCMVHWYDNYFLCYGYQEIKNLSTQGNETKTVFYCNKVQF